MEILFSNNDLQRLDEDRDFHSNLGQPLAKAYRRRVNVIRSATDERDIRAVKGNRFEKLKGDRSHQRSVRLNDQWRLVFEIVPSDPKNKILIIGIEDYH